MFSAFIALLAPTVGEKWAKPAAIALLFALALAIFGLGKCAYDRSVISRHEQKIQNRVAPATNKATNERAADSITNARNEQEAHNVIAAQPDQPISPTSRAHGCLQLRRAGKRLPAGC